MPLKRSLNAFRPTGLFSKYVTAFIGLVVLVLSVNGGLETWFTYTDRTALLAQTQSEKAEGTANRIQQFIKDLEEHFDEESNLVTSEIKGKEAIMDSIKDFLGKGK